LLIASSDLPVIIAISDMFFSKYNFAICLPNALLMRFGRVLDVFAGVCDMGITSSNFMLHSFKKPLQVNNLQGKK